MLKFIMMIKCVILDFLQFIMSIDTLNLEPTDDPIPILANRQLLEVCSILTFI